jgi:hypothetical protein
MAPCEEITKAYLQRSIPLDYINCLDLSDRDLSRYKLLLLPLTSGLAPRELDALRRYVKQGGNLLIAGDSLRYDDHGLPRQDFDLAEEMGVKFERMDRDATGIAGEWKGCEVPADLRIRQYVGVRAVSGESLLVVRKQDQSSPLLHANQLGQGRIAYLATLDSVELTRRVADWMAGPLPLVVTPPNQQAILTRQAEDRRWILHLMNDGAVTVTISKDFAPVREIVSQYPAQGWNCSLEKTPDGVTIIANGNAKDRLLVLK